MGLEHRPRFASEALMLGTPIPCQASGTRAEGPFVVMEAALVPASGSGRYEGDCPSHPRPALGTALGRVRQAWTSLLGGGCVCGPD